MLHADAKEGYVEFEGTGLDLIADIAVVIATSVTEAAKEKGYGADVAMGITSHILNALASKIGNLIEEMMNEESEEDHEEEIHKECSGATVVTDFRKYRRGGRTS